ncbi:MAG: Zn-dependent hydrolase [Betaproteobacteria bacterium]
MAAIVNISINGQRLWDSLMQLAQIGATQKGGVCRLALTELDQQGRDLVVSWAREAGLTITIDKIGNVFMRRPGRNPDKPPVVVGSHIDTQPTGGKFDGNYGVLAGLEVIRTLNDYNIETEAPVEVVFWTNEEGSRFVPVMMGSGVFCKDFTLEHAYSACDVDGKCVRDELESIGYLGQEEPGAHPIGSYFEAHIEQGPVLEDHQKTIGVVEAVLGMRWYDCVVSGQEAHAGPTPMKLRRDALQAATRVMQEVIAIAGRSEHGRGTVGFVQVYPNSRNVIPGEVRFSVDLRNIDDPSLDRMDAELRAAVAEIAAIPGIGAELKQVSYYPPVPFHTTCVNSVRSAAEQLGYSHMPAVSGAGHDAIYMARLAPAGMIFIPCKDGISHNEIEDILPEHATAGANVLFQVVVGHANSVG